MKFAVAFLFVCCAAALPSLAQEPGAAPVAAAPQRPDDALDTVLLVDGGIVRGVVLADDESAVTVRLRSGEQQVIPRAQVRTLNRWKAAPVATPPPPPPAPPAPSAGGLLTITPDGIAVLNDSQGLRTTLTPDEFYKLVGRQDLGDAVHERSTRDLWMIGGGSIAAAAGLVVLVGDLVYVVSHICFTYASSNCQAANSNVAGGLFVGGLLGIGVGTGVAIAGGIARRLDDGGVEERRTLADEYNDRAARSDATEAQPDPAANSKPSPLATLRPIPVAVERGGGLGVAMSF